MAVISMLNQVCAKSGRFGFIAVVAVVLLATQATRINAQDRFVTVPDGMYDSVTGKTWGFSLHSAQGWMGYDQNLFSSGYANTMRIGSEFTIDESGQLVEYDVFYSDFSILFSGVVPPEGEEWRLPTVAEHSEAFAAGLFEILYRNPEHTELATAGTWYVTSETAKVRGGFDGGYAFNVRTGEVKKCGCYFNALTIRGGTTSDGNGQGKGKNK